MSERHDSGSSRARVTYLSFDSIREGVGASQVLPYVRGVAARGHRVVLHSLETDRPADDLADSLRSIGVTWRPHAFGRHGPLGGLGRVLRGARLVRGSELVHARSDLPAASAILARTRPWVWDMRAFWADQRIALGSLRPGSPEDRVLRGVENRAARDSAAIITLTEAARDHLVARHGAQVAGKIHVIPTCVDLRAFPVGPAAADPVVRLLFSGSMNAFYDLPTMLRFADRLRRRRETVFTVLGPPTSWEHVLATADVTRRSVSPGEVGREVSASSVGMSVCRFDGGPSLKAAMPTKVAEFLASGRPVVVNAGLGDLGDLLAGSGAGVVLRDASDAALDRGVAELLELLADPGTATACRALAEAHFDLDRAVRTLDTIYSSLS